MIDVRQIRSDEWERLRDIRLEALLDTPSAFATTFSEAEAFPDSLWQERATAGAVGKEQITVLAVSDERTVGMTVALGRPDSRHKIVPIVSVFVVPSERRKGVARRLLTTAQKWARDHGATRTSLWVEEENVPARRFYESIGYVATLDRQPIRSRPRTWEIRLERALIPAG
jgi:GNAT superfamily N-acetyltransferase